MSLIIDGSGRPISSGKTGGVGPNGAGPNGAPSGALVTETDTERFMDDVVQTSMRVPVIVDFWAPWCGPCKTLGPALEKAVNARGGAVRMVKVNVDENQDLAAQFRVQSIPTVYAFRDGQPVDGFMGALSESQIAAFIDKLTGGAANVIDDALAQAKELLDGGDPANALGVYQQVLAQDPRHAGAIAGALRCQIALGATDDVRGLFDQLPPELLKDPEIQAVKASLEVADLASAAGPASELQAKVDANPDDHQARMDLALALFAGGAEAEAQDQLLESIRRDRTWEEEAARKQLLKFWEALGHAHKVTVAGRRRLSSILFS
ncbi:MAG: thioredoxin [Rhodospirillum sp.]|nr:thioredoxin [Rhodospirillum sp.]MCF8487618.1 thioredoxin [Rhodospirillum sp.]MCF8499222.1 thioredoxin [Rhodospirillum sp.]